MYLLSTRTLQLKEFYGKAIPPYAILSHTWTDDELQFSDIFPSTSKSSKSKAGYEKVTQFAAIASKEGYEYVWVDSCCIDKRSSAELTEAINSMFAYYRDASLCINFLADVPGLTEPDMGPDKAYWLYRFKNSRWFTRGWTLQELIAPKRRIWLTRDWSHIEPADFNDPKATFLDMVSSVTGIAIEVLKDRTTMSQFCVAERMSWASARRTTRPEDLAYSLMGLFGINMAVLYGEGLENAFARLQGEIMKTSFDQTIFAWRGPYASSGLLAQSPQDFARTPKLGLWGRAPLSPYSITNVGLHIRPVVAKTLPNGILAVLQCNITEGYTAGHGVAVRLQRVQDTRVWLNGLTCEAYRRVNCDKLEFVTDFPGAPYVDILVLEDKHADLLDVAKRADDMRWGRVDAGLELVKTPGQVSVRGSLERSKSDTVVSPARSNTDVPVAKRKWKWSSFTSMSNLSTLTLSKSHPSSGGT